MREYAIVFAYDAKCGLRWRIWSPWHSPFVLRGMFKSKENAKLRAKRVNEAHGVFGVDPE